MPLPSRCSAILVLHLLSIKLVNCGLTHSKFLSAVHWWPVVGLVAMVSPLLGISRGANQILPQRTRLLTPLHNAWALGQRDHLEATKKMYYSQEHIRVQLYKLRMYPGTMHYLVCAHTEPPLAGGRLLLEQSVDEHKHLLHDCILTQIILSLWRKWVFRACTKYGQCLLCIWYINGLTHKFIVWSEH